MKSLIVVMSLAALGGCAVVPPGPAYYGTRAVAVPVDPYQWHTVSSEPMQAGYVSAPSNVQYTSEPVYSAPQPVYVEQPVYVQQPVYYPQPYYYNPPVSVGFDFLFVGGRRGWGGYGYGHRGWGGYGGFHGRR